MFIGHHFGKRKPQWNFFIKAYEKFKLSTSAPLAKLALFSFLVQIALLGPVIFWIYQNYSVIENILPAHLDLKENIQFEKKWIVFIIIGLSCVQSFWNYYIWKSFVKNEQNLFHRPVNSLKFVSHDEVDSQHRAS